MSYPINPPGQYNMATPQQPLSGNDPVGSLFLKYRVRHEDIRRIAPPSKTVGPLQTGGFCRRKGYTKTQLINNMINYLTECSVGLGSAVSNTKELERCLLQNKTSPLLTRLTGFLDGELRKHRNCQWLANLIARIKEHMPSPRHSLRLDKNSIGTLIKILDQMSYSQIWCLRA